MADGPTGTPPSPRDRRSSFAGQTFADLFGTSRPRQAVDAANNSPPNQPYTGPISQAAAQAQRRRMSLTTLGLSGSPEGAGSRFNSHRGRHDSISSANSGSIDESAIEDEPMPRDPTTIPVTPFARRMSFGARALRDVRNSSSGGQSGGGTGQNGTNSPPAVSTSTSTTKSKTPNGTISSRDAKGRGLSSLQQQLPRHRHTLSLPHTSHLLTYSAPRIGSADFWNENMRNRAQRTSIAGQADLALPSPPRTAHARAVSVAALEAPIREMPKEPQRPDHFQERILKGDFYMD